MHEKCKKMKKKGQKSLTLSVLRKLLTKKMTKKILREGIERGIEEIDKKLFWKSRIWFLYFLKFEIRLVERNRAGIEIHMKTGLTYWKESGRNQRDWRLLKEKAIFLLHISIGRKQVRFVKFQRHKNFETFWKSFL